MRFKRPDAKNALSILESAKKTMDFTLGLDVSELSAVTITRNIYECFRMLGDALLVSKGLDSEDHLLPIKEVAMVKIDSVRPIAAVENLRILRHNVNYYGYAPAIAEVEDVISLAKACFYLAYEQIKMDLQPATSLHIFNTLQIFNTLTRKKEPFVPLKKEVGLYTCGPTVYNFAHIGNLRSYLFEDLLKRTLLFNNFKVKHVMNITDVGHLTSDSDTGEDKMLKGAQREHKTVWEIADFYTKAFKSDIKKLNIINPNIWCKATDHIKEQIELIKKLEKKGFTYVSGGNVYFDTSKLNDYGKLARLNLDAEQQSRVEKDENKKNYHDFVLWFTKSKFEEQEMKWDSPWGKEGYPGWHIECSAMSMKYLGEQFDIHCGGIDHINIHHTNEIAQSEAATGKKPWVKYWLHGEFLVIGKDTKMAKSGENFVTLAVLEQKGFNPLDYRFFCLGTHYRMPLTFSYDALDGAKTARKRLVEKVLELKKAKDKVDEKKIKTYLDQFTNDVNDDLNVPRTLAIVWEVLKDGKLNDAEKYYLLLKFDEVLGLDLKNVKEEKVDVPAGVKRLAEERLLARKNKDWKKSDELRIEINQRGWDIADVVTGYSLKRK